MEWLSIQRHLTMRVIKAMLGAAMADKPAYILRGAA